MVPYGTTVAKINGLPDFLFFFGMVVLLAAISILHRFRYSGNYYLFIL